MAEDITAHGATADADTIDAAEANRDAIVAASKAADDNTAYIPSGTFYVGDRNRAEFLQPGRSATDLGPRSLSIVGAGPESTYLVVHPEQAHGGVAIRYWEVSHPNTLWEDLTYDGNYTALDLGSNAQQYGLQFDTSGDLTCRNVRFRNMHGSAIKDRDSGMRYEIDRCTFRENGVGRHNATDGSKVSHHLAISGAPAGETSYVRNTVFELCPGTCMDIDLAGTVVAEDCWARSIGNAFVKHIDGSLEASRIYFEGATPELSEALTGSGPDEHAHHGRWFAYRLAGDETITPSLTLNDIEARSLPYHAIEVNAVDSGTYDLEVRGGTSGPIAIHNASTLSTRGEVIRDADSSALVDIDIDKLSVHDSDGVVFDTPDSNGVISTLRRDGNDGLGTTGKVTTENDKAGESPFTPSAPSQDEVGINANQNESPTISWKTPKDGDSVDGTVTVQIDASDVEDSDDSLTVEYRIDDSSWTSTTFNSTTGYYDDDWDTSKLSTGTHTIEGRVTDSNGNSRTASIDVVSESPIKDDWTPRWSSTYEDWNIISNTEFTGKSALEFQRDDGELGRYAISWDAVGTPADVETVDKFKVPNILDEQTRAAQARVHLRGSKGTGNENSYWLDIDHDEDLDPATAFRVGKYTNGGFTPLVRFGSPAEETFYYRRFRAEGNELKAKVWVASESEPTDWDVELTDNDHSSGWVGLGSYDPDPVETDVFSIGTGGETAPISDSDESPSVAFSAPTDGETVSGTVTLQIEAADSKDDDQSLVVDYRVEGGSWREASLNTESGFWESSWDTTASEDGSQTLEARATDTAGNTAKESISVTVDNAEETTSGSAPVVNRFSVSEAQRPDPHAEITAVWDVSDSDGDLDLVEIDVSDSSGTAQGVSWKVSGSTASDTDTFRVQDGDGATFDVTITVTDAAGQSTSVTKSVTA